MIVIGITGKIFGSVPVTVVLGPKHDGNAYGNK
jgi:hypothetical protein